MPDDDARDDLEDDDDEPGRDDDGDDRELRPDEAAPSSGGFPAGTKRGVCSVCGVDAETTRSIYCVDHKPRRSRKDPKPVAGARRPTKPRGGRPTALEGELETQFRMLAMLWSLADPHCATALDQAAPGMAAYWADVAGKNPRARAFLEATTRGGGIIGGITVHAPLVLAIVAHHVAPAIAARRAALEGELEQAPAAGPDPFAVFSATPMPAPAPEPNGNGAARPWDLSDTDPMPTPRTAPWPPEPSAM